MGQSNKLMGKKVRPLKKGEFIDNKDGTHSTERLMGVNHPGINGGKPSLIPSIFMVGDKKVRFKDPDRAAEAAIESGLEFPSFPSHEGPQGSTAFAKKRSSGGGIANGPIGRTKPKLGELMNE
tara:strand:- start:111 stop:479 length:369 start_codon:yes stop_codon:yes gene_type:complete